MRLVAGSAGLGLDVEVFGEDVHVLVLVAVADVQAQDDGALFAVLVAVVAVTGVE